MKPVECFQCSALFNFQPIRPFLPSDNSRELAGRGGESIFFIYNQSLEFKNSIKLDFIKIRVFFVKLYRDKNWDKRDQGPKRFESAENQKALNTESTLTASEKAPKTSSSFILIPLIFYASESNI